MSTAVIILNWNGVSFLRQFLPGVIRCTPEADIIVADNGSTDESLDVLRHDFPTVRVMPFSENLGFADGYNRAIAEAVGYQYVILLNSDIEVSEHWLGPMLTYMDSHPDVAACQPKLLSWHERQQFEYAGAAGGFVDRWGYPYCRGRILDRVESDNGQYDTMADIHWATGACLLIRRQLYLDAGGLDPRFFAHNEEIDLCWRLRLYGHRIVCLPQTHVWHVGGGTLPQGNPRKTYLNFRNNLTMLYKNLPSGQLWRVMAVRFVLDYVALFQQLAKGRMGHVRAILRARRDFNAWRRDYKTIRREIQSRAVCHEPMLTPVSIVWQYFARGRKKFSEL